MRPKQKPAKRADEPRRGRPSKIPLTRSLGAIVARTPRAETATSSIGAPADRPALDRRSCLFVDGNVRSGQTVENIDGDVTVLGSVGSGAEVVAGGSIHVYGTLRGRALAGVGGDRSARILCQKFEAELVSIDGSYRVAENLDPALRGYAIQARLEGTGMMLSRID